MNLIKYIAIIIGCLQLQTAMAGQIWISVKHNDTPLDSVNIVLYNDSTNDLLVKAKTEASGMAFITFNNTIAGNKFRIEFNKAGFKKKIVRRQSSAEILTIEEELYPDSQHLNLYTIGSIILICLVLGIIFKIYRTKKTSRHSHLIRKIRPSKLKQIEK